jgi:hypothetical protein
MKNGITAKILAFGLVIFYGSAFAQSSEKALISEKKSAIAKKKENVERIEVEGNRPKLYYKGEYRKHQKEFITMFNQLVDNSEMEVICDTEAQTGSRVRKQNCQPRFIKTIMAQETQRELSQGRSLTQAANVGERNKVKRKILTEYKKFKKLTEQLLNENPELANHYQNMESALTKLEEFDKK